MFLHLTKNTNDIIIKFSFNIVLNVANFFVKNARYLNKIMIAYIK